MKFSIKFVFALILTTTLILVWRGDPRSVDALQDSSTPALNSTPSPSTPQPPPNLTPTIDPASIGDTTGVTAIGIIVVAVILVGVIWGYHEFRMETQKTRSPKE